MRQITQEQIEEIVYNSVRRIISESFGDKLKNGIYGLVDKMQGSDLNKEPESLKDLIRSRGWEFTMEKMVDNGRDKELTIYQKPYGSALSEDELLDEINSYLEEKHYNVRAVIRPDEEYYYKLILKKI